MSFVPREFYMCWQLELAGMHQIALFKLNVSKHMGRVDITYYRRIYESLCAPDLSLNI